jgi:hypothetical protein
MHPWQWRGVKRGNAFAFCAGDIRVEGTHAFCSSGGNLGNGHTRTALYTDSIRAAPWHGWRAAGQGSVRDCAGGIHQRRAVAAGSCSANTRAEGL